MNKKEANIVWENKPFSPRRERESRQVRPRAIIRQANLSTICQQDANFEPIMCNLMSFSGYFDYASYYQMAYCLEASYSVSQKEIVSQACGQSNFEIFADFTQG